MASLFCMPNLRVMSSDSDLNLGALWSWTIPLWGLFVIVLYLAGELLGTAPLIGAGAPVPMVGGGRKSKKESRQ